MADIALSACSRACVDAHVMDKCRQGDSCTCIMDGMEALLA